MTYAKLLSSYIEKSGLSLSQISTLLKERDFSTDKGYISKLQNGKVPPAGEDLSRALAEVTGNDSEKLVMEGYVEKAPIEVRPLLRWYIDRWDYYVSIVFANIATNDEISEEPLQSEDQLINKIKAMKNDLGILPMEAQLNFIITCYNQIVTDRPNCISALGQQDNILENHIRSTLANVKKLPMKIVELSDVQDDITKMRMGDDITVISPDDSMSGSGIRANSKILCSFLNNKYEFENGKIYLVLFNGEFYIRRLYLQADNLVVIQADNPKFGSIFF
ncbi:S24 family peptidase (plasmid) [Brevibacillus halotolerans]|nr:S24 family peptidase [Brevibacillus halotolerans]